MPLLRNYRWDGCTPDSSCGGLWHNLHRSATDGEFGCVLTKRMFCSESKQWDVTSPTVRSWWRSSHSWCAETSSTARHPPASPWAPSPLGRPSHGQPAARSPPRSAVGICRGRPSWGCTPWSCWYDCHPLKLQNQSHHPLVSPPPSSGHTDTIIRRPWMSH